MVMTIIKEVGVELLVLTYVVYCLIMIYKISTLK